MSSPPRQSTSTDNFIAFRSAFARAFPSTMASDPDTGTGTAHAPIDLGDDSDNPGPQKPVSQGPTAQRPIAQRPVAGKPEVIDLLSSDDDNPVVWRLSSANRKRALNSTPEIDSSSRKASASTAKSPSQRPLLPAKGPSDQSTPPRKSNTPASFKNNSAPQIKISPQSFGKPNNAASQSFGSEVDDSPLSEPDLDDDYEEVEPQRVSPRTPSEHLTHAQSSPRDSNPGTIHSSSPLLLRLAQQRSRPKLDHPRLSAPQEHSQEEEISQTYSSNDEADDQTNAVMGKLEESLVGFYSTMQNDHAATVRWLLHDARVAVEDREPLFMDKVSPFTGMEPAHITPGISIPENSSILKIDFYYNKKNRGKSRVQVISTSIADSISRVPIYYSYTAVKRNVLTGNDEKLRFIPFLGDIEESTKKKATFRKLMLEMERMYSLKQSESGRKPERLAQIRAYLSHWLKQLDLGIGQKELITYFLKRDNEGIDLTRRQVKSLLATFEVELSLDQVEACQKLFEAFEEVFDYSLKDVIFRDEQLKELGELSKKSNNDTPVKDVRMFGTDENPEGHKSDRLETYANLLCLICGAICCQTHGDYQQSPRHGSINDSDSSDEEMGDVGFSYNFRPVIMRYDDLLRKQDVREADKAPDLDLEDVQEEPCSDKCYRTFDFSGLEYEIVPEDLDRIRSMVISLRGKKNRSCDISFILDLPCWQVDCEINMLEPRVIEIDSPGKRPKAPHWYDNKRKTLKDNFGEMTIAHLHQERVQANPCAHDGPCLDECPCHNTNLHCESFCGCSDDCPRRWTGCSCHGSGMLCASEFCICIQMNRECGLQCVSCGAIERINPANKHYDELFRTGCQNVPLQRGVPRKVVMGESQLAGFGLYLAEPVKKGNFIVEYAGEIISTEEADRRGIIYDRQFLSFLFDLNNEWVLDAARLGNNSRFINHADNERDGLNCEAKIVLVNGEHRIKFIALRDLKVGEELLFNYGKKFAEKHGLSKKLPKAREGKRGVVVGEEALAALDGLNPANRATRGKMTAIRGAHGGSRGRKARKTAPLRELVEEDKQAVENEETQEDEDDEEIVDVMSRRKRLIRRPARYTR